MMGQQILNGADIQLSRLSKLGDPLERLGAAINWEMFRVKLWRLTRKDDYSKGGRPPFDVIFMFKIILLQLWNNIADDNTEYLINCRLDWQRFLGMELGEKSPDAKTIWLFKETLGKDGMRELFDLFNEKLEKLGMITREGSLVDATFVDVPRQRNNREENKIIKEGEIPEDWETPENAAKLAQKDTDARWAKKGNETHYGYKDHTKVDEKSKVIVDFEVTSANVHDIKPFPGLITATDTAVYVDSAYADEKLAADLKEKYPGIKIYVVHRAYKNRPLTDEQKAENHEISKVRCRVEHVFRYITRFMGGIYIRTIGIARAARQICGMNLAYNLKRAAFLVAAKKSPVIS